MNDTILKYLAALQEGKSIYTAPERGITLSQINAKKVSDEQSFEFTSNLVVALTDAEGNKSFTDLCSAIDELDSKGVLSVFKAMYKGAFDDKKSIYQDNLNYDVVVFHDKKVLKEQQPTADIQKKQLS